MIRLLSLTLEKRYPGNISCEEIGQEHMVSRGKKFKSAILVSLQFASIASLLFTTKHWRFSLSGLFFITTAVLLVLWAGINMQQSKLRISPIPAENAQLVTTGPYKFIRHPMYTSILLGSAGLLFIYFSWFRLFIAAFLLSVLLFKLTWEEKMLSEKFPGYSDYKKHSKRIIPFLF
jgi:protein-S-isoprenylcysteine O-methyltransferase Ste14